jgi:hypothetical protein
MDYLVNQTIGQHAEQAGLPVWLKLRHPFSGKGVM